MSLSPPYCSLVPQVVMCPLVGHTRVTHSPTSDLLHVPVPAPEIEETSEPFSRHIHTSTHKVCVIFRSKTLICIEDPTCGNQNFQVGNFCFLMSVHGVLSCSHCVCSLRFLIWQPFSSTSSPSPPTSPHLAQTTTRVLLPACVCCEREASWSTTRESQGGVVVVVEVRL